MFSWRRDFNLPVSVDVNGCRGSKGHLSLPDSSVEDSSLNAPSWEGGSREPQFRHLHPTSELAPGHVTFQSYVLYLSATGDFNKSAGRVEGPRPAGVDVCAVVIMEDPDEVRTLQLGATQAENQQRISTNRT